MPGAPERDAGHSPVLLHETVQGLAIREDDVVVDATLGGAGHARAIAGQLGNRGTLIGFDLDEAAIARAQEALQGARPRIVLVQANFRSMREELLKRGVRGITKALFDLGWSSYQLDSGRGFSFMRDEPLEMTYAKGGASLTAAVVVNTWSEQTLADVLYGFGGERYSRRIARAIVERREKKPFTASRELAEAIAEATPRAYRRSRIHPATRSFQAIRIAVNDELGAIAEGLQAAWELLEPGGRIAAISFHSLEDRTVKHLFAGWEKKGEGKRLAKKPIAAAPEETARNPRARSAKLRLIEKTGFEESESFESYDEKNTQNKQIPPLGLPG